MGEGVRQGVAERGISRGFVDDAGHRRYNDAMIRDKGKKKTGSRLQEDTGIFEVQAEVCQTLANPKRLHILSLLKNGELSAGQMMKAMGIPKANLSQHLSIMKQKGILIARREGTVIYYRLATPKITDACTIMRDVLLQLLENREEFSRRIRGANSES
ncbi:MAG TPA: metalloregulator ArsR/SmtB family transcription factor [Syntrophorhabdales bacterium]|nr:metalloregulator ArsR/SmtB family transcription factor [Syntrophorhabdales bacterium]